MSGGYPSIFPSHTSLTCSRCKPLKIGCIIPKILKPRAHVVKYVIIICIIVLLFSLMFLITVCYDVYEGAKIYEIVDLI